MDQDVASEEGQGADSLLQDQIRCALEALRRSGRLTGSRSRRITVQIDPGLVAAAMERSGIKSETDLIEAALAVIAEPDDFAAWLISHRGALDRDFTLAL